MPGIESEKHEGPVGGGAFSISIPSSEVTYMSNTTLPPDQDGRRTSSDTAAPDSRATKAEVQPIPEQDGRRTSSDNALKPDSEATKAEVQPIAPSSPSSATAANIKALRLPPNYGANLGVKKVLTKVPVGKPEKPQFFRTHIADDMTFAAMLLEQKESRERYLVRPDVAPGIAELVRPVQLFTAIDRQNNLFLIPVPLPAEDGTRNSWHESLAQAVEHAKLKWLRIAANMHTKAYDVYEALGALEEPKWPEHNIETLLVVAFRGKIIDSIDHPVVQSLLGQL